MKSETVYPSLAQRTLAAAGLRLNPLAYWRFISLARGTPQRVNGEIAAV
ncbi:hypothetical protein KCP76_04500 [Salmonella enterica subsp. enterica serovar Weltevreden]|nr:hypothetical protein KCP76_04500 [Salmonella enterica subsp. enterica serovar Weltevreden]